MMRNISKAVFFSFLCFATHFFFTSILVFLLKKCCLNTIGLPIIRDVVNNCSVFIYILTGFFYSKIAGRLGTILKAVTFVLITPLFFVTPFVVVGIVSGSDTLNYSHFILSMLVALANFTGYQLRQLDWTVEKKIMVVVAGGIFLTIASVFTNSLREESREKITTPLIESIKQGRYEEVFLLLEKGADVNELDAAEATPLMWAAFTGDIKIMELLYSKGADCTKKGIISIDNFKRIYPSPLAAAAGEGHLEAVKFLVERCDIDVDDKPRIINKFSLIPNDILRPEEMHDFIKKSEDNLSTLLRKKLNSNNTKYLSLLMVYHLNKIIYGNDEISGSYEKNPFSLMAKGRERIDQVYKDFIKTKDDYRYFPDDNGVQRQL